MFFLVFFTWYITLCFCRNMTRTMPLWYAKQYALFKQIDKAHSQLEVVRVPGG